MKDDFYYFMKRLTDAGAKMESHYFQLPVAGSEESIFRERVYCYELYHQLRNVLGNDFPYKLDGEVDKAGHPIIRKKLGAKKPDFIVHVPGTMRRNLVVIEVKPVNVKDEISKLEDDIETLKNFIKEAQYHRAIMLIYGDGRQDLPTEIVTKAESLFGDYENRILLVYHRGAKEKPVVVKKGDSRVARQSVFGFVLSKLRKHTNR